MMDRLFTTNCNELEVMIWKKYTKGKLFYNINNIRYSKGITLEF